MKVQFHFPSPPAMPLRLKLFRNINATILKSLDTLLNQISLHKHTSSYTSLAPLTSPHQSCSIRKLFHKDWLSPTELTKIFTTLDPTSVLPMLHHASSRRDYKPNEPLFTVIVTKLGEVKNFDAINDTLVMMKTRKEFRVSDEFFYKVIRIYGGEEGLEERVVETLFSMPEYDCWPSTKTFNYVLNHLVCSRKLEAVHEVFKGATKLGVEIDECSLNIIIKGLCKNGLLDDAYQVLDEFPKQRCKPNKMTFSTIMHCLCGKGRVDEAFGLIKIMEKEGVSPDAVTFNVLVSGLRKQGRIQEAMELLDTMRLMGCRPNKGTYQEVLYGLLLGKRFVDALHFVQRMRSNSFIPSFLSYKLLVLGLCQQNLLGDVDWVLKSMVSVGFVPRMGMWRTLLRKNFPMHSVPQEVSFSEIVKN